MLSLRRVGLQERQADEASEELPREDRKMTKTPRKKTPMIAYGLPSKDKPPMDDKRKGKALMGKCK